MREVETIRKYFKPIQPSVKSGQENISYEEFQPNYQLENFIHCYWQLSTQHFLETPYFYRVVSDGCVDVFFNLNNTSESFVMGFCKKYTEFEIGQTFNYAGIRFYPSVFPQLFKISAQILKDRDQPLKLILPKLSTFISKEISLNFSQSIHKLDEFFFNTIQEQVIDIDSRFKEALFHIFKTKGYLKTESICAGISVRQLRRLFNYYIGTSPKSFSQVVRFQHILNVKPSLQSLKSNKIFFDVGFYDQAHFIKNFTKFYGVTPTQAFR